MNVYILLLACLVIGSNATKVPNAGGYVPGGAVQYSAPTLLARRTVAHSIASPMYQDSTYTTGGFGIANPSYSFPSANIGSQSSGPIYNSALVSRDIFNSAVIGSGSVLQGYQAPLITKPSLTAVINPVPYGYSDISTYNAGPLVRGLYNTGLSTGPSTYNVGIGSNTVGYNDGIGVPYLLNAPAGVSGSYPHSKKAHGGY